MNVRDIRHQRFTLGDITLLTTSPTHIWPHHLNRTSTVLICARISYQMHRGAGGFSWPRLKNKCTRLGQKAVVASQQTSKQPNDGGGDCVFCTASPQFCAFSVFCKRAMCAPDFSPTSFVFEHNQHQTSHPLGDDNHNACFEIMLNSHNLDEWSLIIMVEIIIMAIYIYVSKMCYQSRWWAEYHWDYHNGDGWGDAGSDWSRADLGWQELLALICSVLCCVFLCFLFCSVLCCVFVCVPLVCSASLCQELLQPQPGALVRGRRQRGESASDLVDHHKRDLMLMRRRVIRVIRGTKYGVDVRNSASNIPFLTFPDIFVWALGR